MEDLTCLLATVRTINNYVYHKLAKFDQNRMIRTTQFFFFFFSFYKKPFHMLNILTVSLAPFWKRFLQVKQFHDAYVFNTRFLSFVFPKITLVWHMKPE